MPELIHHKKHALFVSGIYSHSLVTLITPMASFSLYLEELSLPLCVNFYCTRKGLARQIGSSGSYDGIIPDICQLRNGQRSLPWPTWPIWLTRPGRQLCELDGWIAGWHCLWD